MTLSGSLDWTGKCFRGKVTANGILQEEQPLKCRLGGDYMLCFREQKQRGVARVQRTGDKAIKEDVSML